jgi:hypothetical protein
LEATYKLICHVESKTYTVVKFATDITKRRIVQIANANGAAKVHELAISTD